MIEIPVKSKAQARFMGAVAGGKVKGVSPSIGKDFLRATPTTKGLPQRINGKANGDRKAKITVK